MMTLADVSTTWLTGMDVAEGLGAGHLAPDVARAQLAEVDLILHQRLSMLHVAVDHRHSNHAGDGSDRRKGDAKEGEGLEALRLLLTVLVLHC